MKPLKQWLKVIFAAALVGTIVRLAFFILLAPKDLMVFSNETPYLEILKAFTLGFRFDLSAICYITFLFWLTSLLLPLRWALNIWKITLTLWSFLLIVDIGYFSFYNDRINILVFGFLEDDTWALVKTFWKNYPFVSILVVTASFGYFFHKVINNCFPHQPEFGNRFSFAKTRIIIFTLLFIGARGTFALFPLGDHDTVISSRPFLNTLSFGTAHALIRAIKLKQEVMSTGASAWNANLKDFGYLDKEDKAFEDFFQRKIGPNQTRYDLMKFTTQLNPKLNSKPHVVLIVMESWGYYGIQFQSPEFDLLGDMKKHFSDDLINTNFLSATGATTGSLSCLLAGIPQRPISAFLTENEYLNTRLSTSPALTYKKQGYQTRFIYGGNPGWRDMNKFALNQGFDFVEGEIDIEKKLKENKLTSAGRHDWGVFDEDLFKYIQLTLENATSPQLLVVMTTTNHPPYELPKTARKYNLDINQFTEKNLLIDSTLAKNRFTTFRYSSDALSDFLNQTKENSNIGSNTIVAATADHTFWVKNFSNEETFMRSAVPFYIYIPNDIKKHLTSKQVSNFKNSFGSHQDIWPTLYELSLTNGTYETFGRPMIDDSEKSFSFNNGHAIYTKDRALFVHTPQKFTSYEARGNFLYAPLETNAAEDVIYATKYSALMGSLDSYLHHSKVKQ